MVTHAFFIPAGVYDGPHSPGADAHLQVASATLKLGDGTSFDVPATGPWDTTYAS